ncbi:MAG: M48 family metalloprotease, partial [Kiritimatiellae bacterium]|nr:M48 family metalloprotease [Kiritimatiellia bacterium]
MRVKEDVRQSFGSEMNRRQFLVLTTGAAVGFAFTGCATNPATGRKELMLVSEADELSMDRERAPHQFSADYGAVLDQRLNNYVAAVGSKLAAASHRPQLPYSFRVVNANHANAYTFPAGSIAVTRGLLLEMESEAELAAVLGHEIGHVSARHTAQQMSKGILAQVLVTGVTEYAAQKHKDYAPLAAGLGAVGAGL